MTKNGADAKAHRYFDLKAQKEAIEIELEKAKEELIEVAYERKSPIFYEDTEVIITEYIQKSTPWKSLYKDAFDRLGRADRDDLREMEENKTTVSERVKITRKPFKLIE